MQDFFADLHIHIGRTHTGKPVKITAAKSLTLTAILEAAVYPKGLDIIGVIDCHSPEVMEEISYLIRQGKLEELNEGGFRFENKVTLIPGTEMELYDDLCRGPVHVLGYFSGLEQLRDFSAWLSQRVTNISLSTQRVYEKAEVVQKKVKSMGGMFIPAHVFTPFKSLYGKGVEKSLSEVFDPELIDGIELGLSSNTTMADQIDELHRFTFLTNSDAHSLPKIAREYQVFRLESPTLSSIQKALRGEDGHFVKENFGLNPYLGKYYRTACANCLTPQTDEVCSECGSSKFTKGVSERISELRGEEQPPDRPGYVHQVPLDFIPGLGPKTMEKLFSHFGSEMNVLHAVSEKDISQVVKEDLAKMIAKARTGELSLDQGGGGRYGKVSKEQT